ncbi:hypothetical protein HJO_00590 [Hyphomonas johnsonii MHS-2]|uniref:Uncharacterized protein n=1 Tax=Hyphomonas johnsonii MHS-2 TaxID=1280950 RepID=A0A059FTN1_9PROT|nr:hypothetical protein HJO_00590 [Hyphomonas johnsonii MHS-2]
MDEIRSIIPPFNFEAEEGESLNRQSAHNIINNLAEFIIAAAYVDQRDSGLFDNVESAFDGHRENTRYKRITEGMSATEIRQFERECALRPIEDFKENWGLIIDMLSSDQVPYAVMRVLGFGDFEKATNPMLIRKMRDRYKRFRGYNRKALDPHIALHFAWQYGLNQMRGKVGMPNQTFFLDDQNQVEQDAFFSEMLTQSLLVLMLMLMWDRTYDDLVRGDHPGKAV